MNSSQELQVLKMYETERLLSRMSGDEYKRHLLNHMSYSHAYLSGAAVELASANPVALCEAAMHAAACAWCIADYHNETTPPEPIPAEAWEGIANRWIKAVEKWSKQLKANQAAAYAAPIRERAALKELPIASGPKQSISSTATGPIIGSGGGVTAGTIKNGAASLKRPITDFGAASTGDRVAREAFYTPPMVKRSHKKKPENAGS